MSGNLCEHCLADMTGRQYCGRMGCITKVYVPKQYTKARKPVVQSFGEKPVDPRLAARKK